MRTLTLLLFAVTANAQFVWYYPNEPDPVLYASANNLLMNESVESTDTLWQDATLLRDTILVNWLITNVNGFLKKKRNATIIRTYNRSGTRFYRKKGETLDIVLYSETYFKI